MELIKKIIGFVTNKKNKIEDPNTLEQLKLLVLENLSFKKDIKEKTSLIKKMQVHIENKNIIIDELETRTANAERELKEASGKPLNMDKVAEFLNHKNFKFEKDNNGNSIWKQKPQIKKKKRKKINWDQLQLINDPKLGLQANLKSNPDNPKSMTKPQSGKSKLPTKL
jgi:hypothetical protein